MQFHDKTAYVWMGILPHKKSVNRDKCSFTTKQRIFGVFAIDEPGSSVRALYATLVQSKTMLKKILHDLDGNTSMSILGPYRFACSPSSLQFKVESKKSFRPLKNGTRRGFSIACPTSS